MSEYLGSAFASFVGHRNACSRLPHNHSRILSDQPRQTIPFAPLPLPTSVAQPQAILPPPSVSRLSTSQTTNPPPSKRLRCSQGPTVDIPHTFAPVSLISPVSVLSTPASSVFPFGDAPSTPIVPQPQYHPLSATPVPVPVPYHPKHLYPPQPPAIQHNSLSPPSTSANSSSASLFDNGLALNQTPLSLKRPRESLPPTTPLELATPSTNLNHDAQLSPQSSTLSFPSTSFPFKLEPYHCNHCKLRFEVHDALLSHVKRVHQRPFACKVEGCSACFSKQNHLSRHIRIVHNKERPFACNEPGCGSRFGSKSHLGDHTRAVHMRLRNFKCNICDASWSKRFNLEKHIRIRHLGEKPFKCGTCNLSFGTRSHVTRHELKVHKRAETAPLSNRQ